MDKSELLHAKHKHSTSFSSEENQLEGTMSIKNKVHQVEKIDSNPVPKKKLTGFRYFLTVFSLELTMFLAFLDNTIVYTSLSYIGKEFNDMKDISWVATAYILTFNASQPILTKLSDIFGRKWIFMISTIIFFIGSLLCGASQSLGMLLAFRAVSGIGGAGIVSMAFIIITDLVPLHRRGYGQGAVNSIFGLSSMLGPIIGGSLPEFTTWRWGYYMNLPIAAVTGGALVYLLDLPAPEGKFTDKLKRIDYAGSIISFSSVILFLLGLNFGQHLYPWKSAGVIVPLVLSGVLVLILVFVEHKFVKEPLLPLRLFKIRSFVSILLVNWFIGMVFFSIVIYLPLYFQVVRFETGTKSGVRLMIMLSIIAFLSSMCGLFISKKGIYRPLITIGIALVTIFAGLLCIIQVDTSYSTIYGLTVVGGLGFGFNFVSSFMGIQAAVEPEDVAVATGLGLFSRVLGGALGLSITSTIVNEQLLEKLTGVIPAEDLKSILISPEFIKEGLASEYVQTTIETYVESLRVAWYVLIPMAGLGFIFSLFVKAYPLDQPKHNYQDGELEPKLSDSVAV